MLPQIAEASVPAIDWSTMDLGSFTTEVVSAIKAGTPEALKIVGIVSGVYLLIRIIKRSAK